VAQYRLLGHENRELKSKDFNNDKLDAGEIDAGHTMTALYELTLNASNNCYIGPLRYQ
jgi:Ca-activated chloride channel family protein